MSSQDDSHQSIPPARSPELMSRDHTALLVIDVQERLVPAIARHRHVVWNIGRLLDGARLLGLPVLATEQYPKGLGPTVPELAGRLGATAEKLTFSCCGCSQFQDRLRRLEAQGIHKMLVCGVEAHVCVQQTVLDLLSAAWRVYVAADAVGSRFHVDYHTALRRMESSGATVTTTEAALFEWCETAAAAEFKQISRLVRQQAPPDQGAAT